MSLDTKFRPRTYADVLGQKSTIQILQQYVKSGAGFHQSYLLSGPFGSGKTTLGRILARALLCGQPVDGAPCDQCASCKSLLENGSSTDFFEIDAATNSGKDSIRKIVEEIQYSTFSGKRKLYLFDECFTEDAQLVTTEGPVSIRTLVESRYQGYVLSQDLATDRTVWAPLEGWFSQGVRDTLTLTFSTGVTLTVTSNHRFYTSNRGWVEAGDLVADDTLVEPDPSLGGFRGHPPDPHGLPAYTYLATHVGKGDARLVLRVESIPTMVYDVTVGGTHNFFVTSDGAPGSILVSNCHRLSADALDALLKPLEDNYPGTQDKLLVCIFCTTEPEKMRNTILSRCAPAFIVKPVVPEQVAERLAQICQSEAIEYDMEALRLIGEITECHIRDSLKAVEGVSMLGAVNIPNVSQYLHLDFMNELLALLLDVKRDLPSAVAKAETVLKAMSPITVYEKLVDLSLLVYRSTLGPLPIPSYINQRLVEEGRALGDELLDYADKLASRPGRPTASMLLCDLAQLHRGVQRPIDIPRIATTKSNIDGNVKVQDGKPQLIDGVFVHPRAIKADLPSPVVHSSQLGSGLKPVGLKPLELFSLVKLRVSELQASKVVDIGHEGSDNLGDPGAFPDGGAEGD